MPYITEGAQEEIAETGIAATPGELNYQFTMVALNYIDNNGLCYQSLNDIVGALECAKQEFYRRVVVPYEKQKRKDNGDVYA